jgi:hypothetical protein
MMMKRLLNVAGTRSRWEENELPLANPEAPVLHESVESSSETGSGVMEFGLLDRISAYGFGGLRSL